MLSKGYLLQRCGLCRPVYGAAAIMRTSMKWWFRSLGNFCIGTHVHGILCTFPQDQNRPTWDAPSKVAIGFFMQANSPPLNFFLTIRSGCEKCIALQPATRAQALQCCTQPRTYIRV